MHRPGPLARCGVARGLLAAHGMHAAPAADANGYDEVPYNSQAFAQTHPDRLATLARVFGLNPPEITRCRVLELGCAAGGNLIPLAVALPQAQFVGVDLSLRQVQQGQAAIRALGLGNVRIEHASITDIDARWGGFDFLICHGVFSWIPPAVQDAVLALAARCLGPEGIAYISYNTLPGWHVRGAVRQLLGAGGAAQGTPAQRVAAARATLALMLEAVPADGAPHARQLHAELAQLSGSADWYLFHEHLAPDNTPMYFQQFVERAAAAGLQYLAEADFHSMLPSGLAPDTVARLQAASPDIVAFEQKLDFIRNRHFRQTLLCKAALQPRRGLSPEVLPALWIASAATADAAPAPASAATGDGAVPGLDLRPGVAVRFSLRQGHQVQQQGTSANPLTKAALALLAQRWPLGWRFDDLAGAAVQLAADWVPAAQRAAHTGQLMHDLLQCFVSGLVELRSWQPPCVGGVSPRPRASAWARHEAATLDLVTNLRHEVIRLQPFSLALLRLLDGSRSQAQLVQALDAEVAAGRLALPQTAAPKAADAPEAPTTATTPATPADAAQRRIQVAAAVDHGLQRLASYALLAG